MNALLKYQGNGIRLQLACGGGGLQSNYINHIYVHTFVLSFVQPSQLCEYPDEVQEVGKLTF